jgi:hypothetical protein
MRFPFERRIVKRRPLWVSRALRPQSTHAASLEGEGRNAMGPFCRLLIRPCNALSAMLILSGCSLFRELPTRLPTPHPLGY